MLGYRINLCFHGHKLAVEIDDNRQSDRNVNYEITRKKTIEQVY